MNAHKSVVSNAGPLLAAALGGALVLMDETTGREAARALGLTVRGPLRHDIWISRALVDRLQRDVLKD